MQYSLYQNNRQQLFMIGAVIFVSITAAVIVSTVIIMSLMRGEIANALTSHVQNTSPTAQNVSSCVEPTNTSKPAEAQAATASDTASAGPSVAYGAGNTYAHPYSYGAPKHAVKNTNTTTTTNNISNTETNTNTTTITGSYNPVEIKDNTVNVASNNNTAINSGNNSGNTTNTVLATISNTTSNVNSNNTIASNNTFEQHILSDNNVVAVVPVI